MALAILLLIPLGLFLLVRSGLVAPVIEREAVAAVNRALPPEMSAVIAGASVVLDRHDGIAVSLKGFRVSRDDSLILTVDRATVGVSAASALSGAPDIKRISLSGVTISLPQEGQDAALPPIKSIGDALPKLFDGVRAVIAQTSPGDTAVPIELDGVELARGSQKSFGGIRIVKARISGQGQARSVNATVALDGHEFPMEGQLRGGPSGRGSVSLKAKSVPLPIGRLTTMFSADERDHLPDADRTPVSSDISLSVFEHADGSPDGMTFSVRPTDLLLKLDTGDFVPVKGRFGFRWDAAKAVLRLRQAPLSIGRSKMQFSGAIRDRPKDEGGKEAYQFELIANQGISDPADSPEPGVNFAMRGEGNWIPADRLVRFGNIKLASSAGNAEAAGKLDFSEVVPTAVFAVAVEDFALSGVKQFWPAPVARGARRWVLNNLVGGRVTDGNLMIAEPLKRHMPGTGEQLVGDTRISLSVKGVRFDVTGDIPPVRDADGEVNFKDGETTIHLDRGSAYMPSGRVATASKGTLVIHEENDDGLIMADLDLDVSGKADAIGELISYRPINAQRFRDYRPEDLSGDIDAKVTMRFAINRPDDGPQPEWNVALKLKDAAIATPVEGRQLSELSGGVKVNPERADIDVTGRIDGMPAKISMVQPFGNSGVDGHRDIALSLTDADRHKIASGLDDLVRGTTKVSVEGSADFKALSLSADLGESELILPWLGWSKGSGIAARSTFDLALGGPDGDTEISNFKLEGKTFGADGHITVSSKGLEKASFPQLRLNKGDDASASIKRSGAGYEIEVNGKVFDARSLIRHVRAVLKDEDGNGSGGVPVTVTADVGHVTGFGDESLDKFQLEMRHDGKALQSLSVSAVTENGFPVSITLKGAGKNRTIAAESLDAGAILRFLDIYGQIRGGVLSLSLAGRDSSTLAGNFRLRDFRIFNEPRLRSIVSTGNSGKSLNAAVNREIDTSEVVFDRASADVVISPSGLSVARGAVRGPLLGSTFQGKVYDKNDQMRITGTFMPAYGLNSAFAEIPILGPILGNGRDRGLLGVTFLLEGDFKKPQVTVNPLSVIAPGVFRSIFEFR